jgi:hypothetical protein
MSVRYRHPILSGQISGALPIDEIDVTTSLRLNEQFFNAVPLQDSAVMEPLLGGGTITVTNHILAGRATIMAVETTGFVGTGDFIAALHLVKVSRDAEGGTLTVTRWFNGRKRIRVYYGVGVQNVPDEVIAGASIAPYTVILTYAGWFEGAGSMDLSAKTIWAVGNKYGLKGVYKPYAVQMSEGTETGGVAKGYFNGDPASSVIGGEGGAEAVDTGDVVTDAVSSSAEHTSVIPDGDNPNPTWTAGTEPADSGNATPAEAGANT